MRALMMVAVSAVVALSLPMARTAAAGCDPVGEIRFVCGQAGPEDLVAVPGTAWLIASAYGAGGGVNLIDTKAATSTRLFPSATAKERLSAPYDACPGPLEGTDRETFRTHGLYLKPGRNGVHTLYVVHHGRRESVEIFEVDARAKPPGITWIGCAVAPDPIGLNAVVALPDGGFAATNFDPRRPAGARGFSPELLEGKTNGEVWEWHTGRWSKVPGSEAAGANGLDLSDDGRWIYMAAWGSQSLIKLSRGRTPPERTEVPLGFRVDNLHRARDGSMLAAGQGQGSSDVVRIDPKTLAVSKLVHRPDDASFRGGTAAAEVGDRLWVGSFGGDRIALLKP